MWKDAKMYLHTVSTFTSYNQPSTIADVSNLCQSVRLETNHRVQSSSHTNLYHHKYQQRLALTGCWMPFLSQPTYVCQSTEGKADQHTNSIIIPVVNILAVMCKISQSRYLVSSGYFLNLQDSF